MDVPGHAGDAEFLANVAAGAAAAHGSQTHAVGLEIVEQVLDQVAAAISGIGPVAVLTGPVEVIQAGQVRHRDAFRGALGQPGIDRLGRLVLAGGYDLLRTGRVVGIDRWIE